MSSSHPPSSDAAAAEEPPRDAAPAPVDKPWAQLGALLFVSGFCSLVYQVAWFRLLRLIFGASTTANAAVVAIFMGGLGLGGVLLGKRAARSANPMALYARVELGIAVTAAASPFLALLANAVYLGLGGSATLGGVGAAAARLLLALGVLGACTTLMGGTLPAASQAIERHGDGGRRMVAWLYGINTLGAVTGALTATFFSIELLGIRRSLWVAALVNVLLAMAAHSLSRHRAFAPRPRTTPADTADEAPKPRQRLSPRARVVLPAAGLVGFIFFLMEIVWYRMLAPVLGGSSFTFGLILAVALLGIGTGGLLYALGADRRRPTLGALAVTCALEAVLLVAPFAAGDSLAMLAAAVRPLSATGFGGLVAGWGLVACLVALPASIVAGYQFPLLVALLGGDREGVGWEVGLTYGWNTWGAILGSLAGGFGLLPLLGANRLWRVSTLLLVALTVILVLLPRLRSGPFRDEPRRGAAVAVGLALVALALTTAGGPTAFWRHMPIGVGRVAVDFKDPNELQSFLNLSRRGVIAEAEGVESSVALVRDNDLALIVNGKSDGSARGDAATNIMSGLIGALLHEEPKRVLVIGLGTGVTAGWLAQVESVERVDVVELEPAVVGFARDFGSVNFDVVDHPKVRLLYGDGREYVRTRAETYDVIFSEPSNPYRVGVADLFSQDFYRSVVERLGPGGVFLQWLQGYEVDPSLIQTTYATLGSVFPSIETWRVHGKDLLLVATREPIPHDLDRGAQRVEREPYRSALRRVWGVDGLEGFYSGFVGGDRLADVLAAAVPAVSTDDRPTMEFGFARNVGQTGRFDLDELAVLARGLGADRPNMDAPETVHLDPDRLLEMRRARSTLVSFVQGPRTGASLSRDGGDPLGDAISPRQRARLAYARGELGAAAEAWPLGDPEGEGRPRCHLDRLLVAEASAELGDTDLAEPRIAALRADAPTEADVVQARLAWRRGDAEAATDALVRAFERLRGDPWVHIPIMDRGFRLAKDIALADRAQGGRLLAVLDRPFAAHLFEEVRLAVRLNLAGRLGFGEHCVAAFEGFEPHVLWNRSFLEARERCYRLTSHPLAPQAALELDRFRAADAPGFQLPEPPPRPEPPSGGGS